MTSLTQILIPIFKGVIFFIFVGFVLYGLFSLLKLIGIFKLFSGKRKIPDYVYVEISNHIADGKSYDDLLQYLTRFPKWKQEQYIYAYDEMMEVDNEDDEID